ncbi:MAG: hypothetical protein ACRDL5_19365 [Solirubrobacteraceae bacterium]
MAGPSFRFVSVAAALRGAPGEWAREMLHDGEVALQAGGDGLDALDEVARALGLPAVLLIRGEPTPATQEETVISFAGELPLVWAAASFGERTRQWARGRGAMTLLVETAAPLTGEDRARIERFIAALGRQSE